MKKFMPWIMTVVVAIAIAAQLRAPDHDGGKNWEAFGKLPVILKGRAKPLDTVARTSLLVIHDKQALRLETPKDRPAMHWLAKVLQAPSLVPREKLPAIQWLAEVLFDPQAADDRKVFTIHDPDVLGLFGWQQEEDKVFSMDQLRPHIEEIQRQARLVAAVEAQHRDRFQNHIFELYNQLVLYHELKNSLQLEDSPDFEREIAMYESTIRPGLEAMNQRAAGQDFDKDVFNSFLFFADRYRTATEFAHFLSIPLDNPESGANRTDWENVGTSLIGSTRTGSIHPVLAMYAELGSTYRADDVAGFNQALDELTAWFGDRYGPELKKSADETFFNRYQPFYKAMVIYLAVFLLACASWLFKPGWIGRTAFLLAGLAFVIHTSGLVFRVYLQEYPPVTNLYSAAVLVGWGAAAIGLVLEMLFKNAIGSSVLAVVGFCSLLVAHHHSFGGDTMEMMQAVLDSNFWLAVHVPTIVLGYSTTFAAGTIGLFYILLGVFSRMITPELNRTLTRATYGVVCFATLLSFVGTVLGGIWADQSWGRFWGWDPKENGAALIVLWNAIILHARWGGYIRERGMMVMAVFGSVITAWSYYGTNLLGIGLHSYGFTSSGAYRLGAFMLFHLVVMMIAAIPTEHWKSFAKNRKAPV